MKKMVKNEITGYSIIELLDSSTPIPTPEPGTVDADVQNTVSSTITRISLEGNIDHPFNIIPKNMTATAAKSIIFSVKEEIYSSLSSERAV